MHYGTRGKTLDKGPVDNLWNGFRRFSVEGLGRPVFGGEPGVGDGQVDGAMRRMPLDFDAPGSIDSHEETEHRRGAQIGQRQGDLEHGTGGVRGPAGARFDPALVVLVVTPETSVDPVALR